MNSLRIALTELRRLTAGRLPRIALLAMVLIPTLYGGLYLYANNDPYGRLDQVPAALVVEDQPASIDGKETSVGRDVADQLLESGDFDWHEVSAAEAESGVEDGDYDFALTIPRDFSASLASTADFDPEQAQLRMTTNDANSYLSTTIANQVTTQVRDSIARQVSEEAANQFLLGIADIRGSLVKAADGADRLADGLDTAASGSADLVDGADRLHTGTTRLADGAGTLSSGAGDLDDGLATLETKTAQLPAQTRKLAEGADQVADGDEQIAAIGDRASDAVDDLDGVYDEKRADLQDLMQEQGLTPAQQRAILQRYDDFGTRVSTATDKVQQASDDLDQLATGARAVARGAGRLADSAPALTQGIKQAHAGSTSLASGADDLAAGASEADQGAAALESGARKLQTGLDELGPGADKLATSLHRGVKQLPVVDDDTRASVARTIGNPVAVENTAQTAAATYGAGLAPFFLALAGWIGGYVLFLLFKPLSRRAMAANQSAVRVALGGWLAPALVGVAQMAVMLTVVAFAVGVHPADFPATLAFLVLVSAVFVAIVHMLNAWLGAVGQFLGLVLMVVQLVSAGGTFPWQTIPAALYPVHHVLPMSYAVDGLRQLMYGGEVDRVAGDVVVLLAWGVGAVALTSIAARRQRRWTVGRIQPELTL